MRRYVLAKPFIVSAHFAIIFLTMAPSIAKNSDCDSERAVIEIIKTMRLRKKCNQILETYKNYHINDNCKAEKGKWAEIVGWCYVFDRRDYKSGVDLMSKFIDQYLDRDQLVYLYAFANFRLNRFSISRKYFQHFIKNLEAVNGPTNPLLNDAWILLAISMDNESNYSSSSVEKNVLQRDALNTWIGFIEFCTDSGCSTEQVSLAEAEIERLRFLIENRSTDP